MFGMFAIGYQWAYPTITVPYAVQAGVTLYYWYTVAIAMAGGWLGFGRRRLWPVSRNCPGIHLSVQGKPQKTLDEDSRYS